MEKWFELWTTQIYGVQCAGPPSPSEAMIASQCAKVLSCSKVRALTHPKMKRTLRVLWRETFLSSELSLIFHKMQKPVLASVITLRGKKSQWEKCYRWKWSQDLVSQGREGGQAGPSSGAGCGAKARRCALALLPLSCAPHNHKQRPHTAVTRGRWAPENHLGKQRSGFNSNLDPPRRCGHSEIT